MSRYKVLCEDFRIYILERFHNDWEKAIDYCEYLISEIVEVDDLESLGMIYFVLSYLNSHVLNYKKTTEYVEKAEKLLIKLSYDELLLDLYGIVATFHNKKGYYKMTFKYAYKGLKIAQELYDKTEDKEYQDELIAINLFMASTCFKLGVTSMGNFYLNEVVDVLDLREITRSDIFYNLYTCYYMNSNFELAKENAEKCFNLMKNTKNRTPEKGLIECLIPIVKCDIKLGNLDLALKNLFVIEEKLNFNRGYIYFLYGKIYEAKGEKKRANEYYIIAYKMYEKDERYAEALRSLKKIIDYYEEKEDVLNELKFRKLFMKFNSKVNTVEEDYMLLECVSKFHMERLNIEKEKVLSAQKLAYNKDIEKLAYKLITTVDELNSVQNQINEKNKTIKVIAERLSRDSMTGVYNKEYIIEKINEIENNENEFFIAMLDLDNYKKINDKYGHLFGDNVLKDVAWSIQNELREGDFLGRFGGEEFIVVYKNKRLDYVVRSTERIRTSIENLRWKNGAKLTISIGVAKHNFRKKSGYLETLKKADKNLYEAKNKGKNMVCI